MWLGGGKKPTQDRYVGSSTERPVRKKKSILKMNKPLRTWGVKAINMSLIFHGSKVGRALCVIKHFPIYTSSWSTADYHLFGDTFLFVCLYLISAWLANTDSLLLGAQQVQIDHFCLFPLLTLCLFAFNRTHHILSPVTADVEDATFTVNHTCMITQYYTCKSPLLYLEARAWNNLMPPDDTHLQRVTSRC